MGESRIVSGIAVAFNRCRIRHSDSITNLDPKEMDMKTLAMGVLGALLGLVVAGEAEAGSGRGGASGGRGGFRGGFQGGYRGGSSTGNRDAFRGVSRNNFRGNFRDGNQRVKRA